MGLSIAFEKLNCLFSIAPEANLLEKRRRGRRCKTVFYTRRTLLRTLGCRASDAGPTSGPWWCGMLSRRWRRMRPEVNARRVTSASEAD